MPAYKSYAALRNNEDIEGVGHFRVKFEGKFTFGLCYCQGFGAPSYADLFVDTN